jgi:hypothetical protein
MHQAGRRLGSSRDWTSSQIRNGSIGNLTGYPIPACHVGSRSFGVQRQQNMSKILPISGWKYKPKVGCPETPVSLQRPWHLRPKDPHTFCTSSAGARQTPILQNHRLEIKPPSHGYGVFDEQHVSSAFAESSAILVSHDEAHQPWSWRLPSECSIRNAACPCGSS